MILIRQEWARRTVIKKDIVVIRLVIKDISRYIPSCKIFRQ